VSDSDLNFSLEIPASAIPSGFRFAAMRAGIKASGRLDFACALADEPVAAAAMFTSNQVVAAPVVIGRKHLLLTKGRVRGVVVNAGNANCATGQAGLDAALLVCDAAAKQFGCIPQEVIPSSTGIIGVVLPAEKLVAALPALYGELGATPEHFAQFARAIMTTDTRAKAAYAAVDIGGKTIRVLGTTKGAGMIQPKLVAGPPHATMLAYLFTDVVIESNALQAILERAVNASFNRISIDGDTSTNDTILLLASGRSGVSFRSDEDMQKFSAALTEVCVSLAKQMVADGEGMGHIVELQIAGAHSDEDALQIARSIANSPLVKTAWAGTDPNWGRILAAIGYAGVPIDAGRISIHFGELEICRDGALSAFFDEASAHAVLQQAEFSIHVDLHLGEGKCRFWSCDLTSEYVKINADYST
jgi:glutamate N-acetyltransferase/amino-acid N-acetyltransferase